MEEDEEDSLPDWGQFAKLKLVITFSTTNHNTHLAPRSRAELTPH